jgi:hypothetical protein
MISLENASPIPLALRYCSPVTPVASNSPTFSTTSLKLFHGNTGSSYMVKNLPTALFISRFVHSGAVPYRHSNFALSHHPSSCLVTNTNSCPFHIPRSGISSCAARFSDAGDKPKRFIASTMIWFTSTNIEPPSSTGNAGLSQTFTVVVRPPIYELRSKTVMFVGIEASAAYWAR